MKRAVFASLLALFVLTVVFQARSSAINHAPSASGGFRFVLEDGNSRFVEFNARMEGDQARGNFSFTDPTAEGVDGSAGVNVRANFDCLRIDGNRAVIGGVISSSNLLDRIGRRVLLVVEDNGEGINAAPDRLTWGIYELPDTSWTPTDAERDDDIGATLRWIATDAEREDDAGIPSHIDQTVRCETFSFASYSFVDIPHGSGNVQVRP